MTSSQEGNPFSMSGALGGTLWLESDDGDDSEEIPPAPRVDQSWRTGAQEYGELGSALPPPMQPGYGILVAERGLILPSAGWSDLPAGLVAGGSSGSGELEEAWGEGGLGDNHGAHNGVHHEEEAAVRPALEAEQLPPAGSRLQTLARHNTVVRRSELNIKRWTKIVRRISTQFSLNEGRGRFITITCGGIRHVTYETTLRKYPGTLLTDMILEEDTRKERRSQFHVYDRSPLVFMEILNIYRTEMISWNPPNIPRERWITDLKYFRMNCANNLVGASEIDRLDKEITLFDQSATIVESEDELDDVRPIPAKGTVKAFLHKCFKQPRSTPGMVASSLSMMCIIVSVTLVCIETLPFISTNDMLVHSFDSTDFGIVLYFTCDYGGRWYLSPKRGAFLTRPFNIIDVLTIVPSYFTFSGRMAGDDERFGTLKFFRVLRVLRIFKLGRYLPGLQVLVRTAHGCKDEMGLLFFCFFVFAVLFSTLIFYAEMEVVTPLYEPFDSIPISIWWAIVTMTSLGYGDMVPVTGFGKVVGSVAAISGIILIALPISVISSTFGTQFKLFNKQRQEKERRVQANDARRKQVISSLVHTSSSRRSLGSFSNSNMSQGKGPSVRLPDGTQTTRVGQLKQWSQDRPRR